MTTPDPDDLAAIAHDVATARALYAALSAADQEAVAAVLNELAASGRGAAVLLASVQLGLEAFASCASAGLLRDEDGPLSLQAFLDLAVLNQSASGPDEAG
ncbi:hypothetical protein [Mycobacterium sp. OTB74]|jgi:hypothetical protein|uniref:hypothetical protein n=1 Tax=Mycobacterium sp. OTB74 TaxID=1853452 RepID=UPI002475844A|nr:hypothetical protein [Mycobacterium sp. OTB74]MDH6245172.1 hypothetical protein [Mycobacterium sp. OTB74]